MFDFVDLFEITYYFNALSFDVLIRKKIFT